MVQKLARFVLLACAFAWTPDLGPVVYAQGPNCECWGVITTSHYVLPDPICAVHPYHWSNTTSTALACHNWCVSTLNFRAPAICAGDTGTCDGVSPASWTYDGYVLWNGTPSYFTSVARHSPTCP